MNLANADQLQIGTISSLTGVNPVTLRAWERRYGLIKPLRTGSGHRLYTHEHVERIRRVVALVARGVPLRRVREILDAEARSGETARPRGPWRGYLDRMAAAITRFDEPELDRVYDEALSLHPIEQVTRGLLVPLLIHLGNRWSDLPGAVAEEHFFATYIRSKLGARLQHRTRYALGPLIVAACAPGEQHELGLLLFALEAHEAGLRTILLGADTPAQDLALAQQRCGGAAVVISGCVEPAHGFLEAALPALVRQVKVPVFVGGAAAVRHRQAIKAAGAVPVVAEIEVGVRLIAKTIEAGIGAQ